MLMLLMNLFVLSLSYLGIAVAGTAVDEENPAVRTESNISSRIANAIKTNLADTKSSLRSEFSDMSPEVTQDILKMIKNSKVDRSKYRDLFFIKKRNIINGSKEIISYDIKERIVPKEDFIRWDNNDFYIKIFLVLITLLLTSLVFATTLKVYQNFIHIKYLTKGELT